MDWNDIHHKMTRNVFLNIELLLNDGIGDISEYDVQSFMFMYLKRVLQNTTMDIKREKEGKFDCVIYDASRAKYYYEIKSYYKEHEKLNKNDFDKDIKKLKEKISKVEDSRGYMFISGSKKKFNDDILANFNFIHRHLKVGDSHWYDYNLPDGEAVKLRPSRKQHQGRSVLVTWEVKLA